MGKIAFLFAGQGAQYPGMGKDLAENGSEAARLFEMADDLCPGTSARCFGGTAEELRQTVHTQPCVFLVALAAAKELVAQEIVPQGAAGFSLGEVAALTFAGAFTESEGFRLVCSRAELMQQASEEQPGGMVAVLKLPDQKVEELCRVFGGMYPVNYNSDGQLVVAGPESNLSAFCEAVAGAGGRAKPLSVGGAFHSPLMRSARDGIGELLAKVTPEPLSIPVYANLTASPYQEQELRETLSKQIVSPVRWRQTMLRMAQDGFDCFVEVGPGKTLAGLCKRTLPQARIYSVEDCKGLDLVKNELGAKRVEEK